MIDDAGPFHEGELALQRATGEGEAAAGNGRIIAERLSPNAVRFVACCGFVVAASIDGAGQPWCSPLIGPPGSFTAPEATRVALERSAVRVDDPLWANLHTDPLIGLVFIEPASRRRYRVNGRVADADSDPLIVEVAEALGNCPKYITRRQIVVGAHDPGAVASVAEVGAHLGEAERAIITAADMCFVASAHPAGHPDASHRGGRPGFVQVRDDRLWIPDYPGNSMFTTLGNLQVHPLAGLLFIDFAGRETLQLTGTTTIDLRAHDEHGATGGTGRAWTFTPTGWRRALLPARLRAERRELSPFNP